MINRKIFIQANGKQYVGALLAKYALEREMRSEKIPVEILNVDEIPEFRKLEHKSYLRKGRLVVAEPNDLQHFTLTRFMPPEKMNFQGRAVVIDPDIFALTDINELFDTEMNGKAILACRKKDAWDTSVMLLDCTRLTHWKIADIIDKLISRTTDYNTIMTLKGEDSVGEIPRLWNSLDILTPLTKMLHTTNRLTQPWRTGLPIDFTRNPLSKYFGLIPREPIFKLLGKYPSHYQVHPDKTIETFFFNLAKDALKAGILTDEMVKEEITQGHLRKDFLEVLSKV